MPAKATYSAGTAYLTVVPSFLGIEEAFKKQVRDMAQAADKDIAAGMARGLKEASRQAKGSGAQAGKDYAGAYEAEAKKRLNAAWRSLPEPQPDVNLRKWDKALATVRAEMKELSEQRIGIDIDQATFDRAVDDFRRRLEALRDTAVGVNKDRNWFNANAAVGNLGDLQEFARTVTRQAGEAGDQAGSAFNERMARVLRDGLGRIPEIRLTADSSDAERTLAELRQRMLALQTRRIGVDIDAGAAYAELRAIHSELQRLDRTSVRVDIRTNAHEAAAGMGQFIQQAELAGRSTQGIGQRANFSMSRLEYLIALGASLGTSIVPAALAAAGAVGMIGTSAIAAVAGIGVFSLGVSGVSDAVKALDGYQKDQAKSANSVNQAQRQMASSTNQVRMAQLSLANTRRTVAQQEEDAARRVADAERGVGDARRAATREVVDAARAVTDARRAAARAEQEVGEARREAQRDLVDAARAVRDAQRGVTDAEQDARDVRLALNDAIREATRDIQELDVALARNSLDQQKAVTAQMEALEELNALKMNPRATEVELRRAKDSYDEQTVRLLELGQKQKELAEDKARADKQGVEGDERVIAARRRIGEADERVARAREKLAREQEERREAELRAQQSISDAQDRAARAQERVARAQEDQREAEYQGQRRIADAERQVADARRAQARQQQDAQFQLAQAANSVTQAQQAQQQAWEKSGIAGGAALEKLNEQMAELSPAAQRFAKFLFGLKDEVLSLRAAAAEPLLPALEEAIGLLLPYLPAVERFVGKIAGAMGDLAIKSVQALGDPVWQRFFHYIDRTAVPSLEMLFEAGQNTAQGLISLFLALTPFNDQAGTGLVDLSRDFALWAERLNKSQGYQEFLEYVRENGPRVVKFLGEIGELLIDLVVAAAPLGSIVLRSLTLLVDAINSIPQPALTALVLAIGAVSLGLTVLGGIMRVNKFWQQMTDIFGPRTSQMVQKYAIDTGRATQETSAFGKATATVSGMAAAAGTKVQGLGAAVGGLAGRMTSATAGTAPLVKGMDSVQTATFNAALAVNGPGGMAGAVQAAGTQVARFGTAAGLAAATVGGPGGLAAGASTAAGSVDGLARSAGSATTAIGSKFVSGLGSAVAFMGGPWGIALAAATLAIADFATKSAEQKQKVDSLKSALAALTGEYRDLALVGKQAGDEADNAFRAIVKNNPDMQRAVIQLDQLGINFDQMMKAATSGDPSEVLRKINDEISRQNELAAEWERTQRVYAGPADKNPYNQRVKDLEAMRDAFAENAKAIGTANTAIGILNESLDRNQVLEHAKINAARTGTLAQQNLVAEYDKNAKGIDVLNGLLVTFSSVESTAAQKADAMRKAIDLQNASVVTAIENDETFASKLISLREQVNQAKAAHDKHATSLDMNSATALRNRDALEDAATAVREMYLQDIASGRPMKDATDAHNKRIEALRKEARDLGLTKTETNKLIKAYGEVPENVKTVVTMDPNSFDTVYRNLQRMQFMQSMLKVGMDPAKAEKEWQDYQREMNRAIKRAGGGPIVGPGTKTSDSVLMWGSDGEYVEQASAVDYYGEPFMAALNERRIRKDDLPGFATGGKVTKWPMAVDVRKSWVPTRKWIEEQMYGAEGPLGAEGGGRGWRWQIGTLRNRFPGLDLYSGYRANSYTASGNLSWHSRDGGRAVDVPPRRDVFNFIHDNYGKNTQELIWLGDPNRNIQRGHHHRFDAALLQQHGTAGMPNAHIHWAFDEGGMLPEGESTVFNGTGRPEPVLTDQQWKAISALARGGDGASGATYNFEFRDTTLDAGKLRALQDREAVMARQGRAH